MDEAATFEAVRDVVVTTLGIEERTAALDRDTVLLGGLPELDSMAVLEVVEALESRFGFEIDDTELTGEVFETLGSLTQFVADKAA